MPVHFWATQVQEEFAACALDIKRVFAGEQRKVALEWSTDSLYYVTTILMRANKTTEAWWEGVGTGGEVDCCFMTPIS